MDRLGPWMSRTFNHLQAHWRAHLAPVLAFAGLMFVMIVALVVILVALMIAVGEPYAGLVPTLGVLLSLPLAVVMMPFMAGYVRIILAAEAGEAPRAGLLMPPLGEAGRAILLGVIQLSALALGALLCLLPGMVAYIALSKALPIMVIRQCGPAEACRASLRLFRQHPVELIAFNVLLNVIASALGGIPIVGMGVVFAILITAWTLVTVELLDEAPPGG